MELGRIQNHLLCCGAAALDLGAFTGFLYGFNEREHIYDIVEYVSGQRFHPDWTRVGGLWRDLPDDDTFRRMIRNFIDVRMPKALGDIETLLNRNRIFIDRLQGIGVIDAKEAVAWGLSGPMARASGVRRDIRKDEPYLCYAANWDGEGAEPVQFSVPVSQDGDCLARYMVRLEEMRQSKRIIEQLIDRIPQGPVNSTANAKIRDPEKGDIYGSIEGTIQNFELRMWNRGVDAPVGEVYSAIESPNGELGYYLVADGGRCAWRARTRPPSFVNYSVFPRLIEGHQLADVVAIIGSINVIAAELDR
jgi:NADH-quinone oxidoreductase subunit D